MIVIEEVMRSLREKGSYCHSCWVTVALIV